MRLNYFLCAETIVRDAETNSVSAVNIFEEVNTFGFPALVPRLAIVVASARDADEPAQQTLHIRMRLGDNMLFERDINVDFQDKLVNRAILAFQGLVMPAPGSLEIDVSHTGVLFAAIRLPVRRVTAEQLPFALETLPASSTGSAA